MTSPIPRRYGAGLLDEEGLLRRTLQLICSVATLSTAARAQTLLPVPSFQLERIELDPSAIGSLVLGSGRILAPGSYRLSGLVDEEPRGLLAYRNNQYVGVVVRSRTTVHLTAAYAATEHLEFGLQLAAVVLQLGDDLRAAGIQSPAVAGLSTPVISGRYAIFRQGQDVYGRSSPFDFAAQLGVGAPIGSGQALANDPGFSFLPKLIASREMGSPIDRRLLALGSFIASAELGALIRHSVDIGQSRIGSQLEGGLSLAAVGEKIRGEITLRSALPITGIPAGGELLAGARYQVTPDTNLFLIGGPGFGSAPGWPAFRIMLGADFGRGTVRPPPEEPKPEPAKEAPPPPPPGPCEAGQAHQPWQCPELDDDQDGVKNGIDRCPMEKGLPEYQGCPIPDRDGDGIVDAIDRCPDEPGPPDNYGCPVKDTDNDGIPDHLDNCPTEPGPASNHGCPIKKVQQVTITREKLEIQGAIFFDLNKATIQAQSFPLLDQIAGIINAHPNIPLIRIEGHTDNTGNAEANRKLSGARAHSVRLYLINKGVPPLRLASVGYGPDKPIAPNDTKANRARNRRVEFRIVQPDESAPAAAAPIQPAPKDAAAASPPEKAKPPAAPAAPAGEPSAASGQAANQAQTYTIRRGDELGKIASQHHVSLKALLEANPGIKPEKISVGQVIRLPTPPKAKP